MINRVTKKEVPELFIDISEGRVDTPYQEHRRNSNFYRYDIIEFKIENKKRYPNLANYDDYIGTWQTNTYIYDPEYGSDEINELTRVEKREKVITVNEWVKCTV